MSNKDKNIGNFTVEVKHASNSVLKVKNALVKITYQHKSRGRSTSYNPIQATTISGIAKFTNIPLDFYEMEISKEWYESVIIKKASLKNSDKNQHFHFVKSKNLLEVSLWRLPYVIFNGSKLCWVKKGNKLKYWQAVSGRKKYRSSQFQNLKNKGPLPEGRWIVKQSEYQKMPDRNWIEMILAEVGRTSWPGGESAWGRNRIWIHPLNDTTTYGRSAFSIHGGDAPGSAGCIDLTNSMPEFVKMFLEYKKDMLLVVKYEKQDHHN